MRIFFYYRQSLSQETDKKGKQNVPFLLQKNLYSFCYWSDCLFQNWLYIFLFVSLKEVDAALVHVAKAKPGPNFFRELGDKGKEHFWYWKIHLAFYLIIWYELNVFLKTFSWILLQPYLASSCLLGKSLSYARERKEAGNWKPSEVQEETWKKLKSLFGREEG